MKLAIAIGLFFLIAQQQLSCDPLRAEAPAPPSMHVTGWGNVQWPDGGYAVAGKLRENDRRVLSEAGPSWVDYVTGNLDEIVYFDVESFASGIFTELVGVSGCDADDTRWAAIATKSKSAVEMGRILAHEAAHMEVAGTARQADSEGYALRVEAKYAAALEHSRRPQSPNVWSWWPWR